MDLETYVREDATRWYAVHARIDALGFALVALADALEPQRKAAFIESLRVIRRALTGLDAKAATVGQIDQILQMLKVEGSGPTSHPSD